MKSVKNWLKWHENWLKSFAVFDTPTPIVGVNRKANNWKNEKCSKLPTIMVFNKIEKKSLMNKKLTGGQTHRNRNSQEDDLKAKHTRR